MLQLTPRGEVAAAPPADVDALRAEFSARHCVRLRGFIEPRVLAKIQAQVAAAPFAARAHGSISTELCMQPHPGIGLLHFLVNDPVVFRLVEQVSGLHGLSFFVGRVYRMLAGSGHYDSWHTDVGRDHQIGMSVNLSTEPYEGGVFQIRRPGEEPASLPNTGAGDAILFAIADDLEHRVTPMEGAAAKTAFAGWFGTKQDYRDVVPHPSRPRRSA